MEGQFKVLFDQMKIEMEKQTNTIFEKINKQLEPLIEENKIMKSKIEVLERKIEYLEKEKKKNNILVFGLEEKEKSSLELLQVVQDTIKADLKIALETSDVSKIHRIGAIKENKIRPVLIAFTNSWKRSEIVKMRRSLKQVYVTEDFPKEVLEKRRELLPKLKEERAKGNFAYIRYDQLIVKEGNLNNFNKEKRKRDPSTSPENQNYAKKLVSNISSIKGNRRNAFDMMRPRSNSLSQNKLAEIKKHKTLQNKYDFLENTLKGVNKLRTKKGKRDKLGDETRKLMEERNELLEKRKDNRQKIANISKKIQVSIRRHRKKERLNILKEQIEKTGGIKKGLKQLKEYTQWIPNIKNQNKKKTGQLTTKRLSIAKVATEFYKELYTEKDKII
ncbi:Endonuclease-reverse transcriptase, partial [Operophtera brumata]